MKSASFVLFISFTCFSNCFPQLTEVKIKEIYSFKVTDLPAKDLEVKYKQLDQLWQELNADTASNLPVIRKELQKSGYSSYFYFDMSSYLEMQSYRNSDKRIIADALKRIEWTDIGTWELIEKLRDFSLNGIDVTGLAFQLLKQEKVKLTNPETGEVFNQGKTLAYLLFPVKKELYLNAISSHFENASAESQRSIITLLWMSNTAFGDERLQKMVTDKSLNSEVRSYATRLMQRFPPEEDTINKYIDLNTEEKKLLLVNQYDKILTEWSENTWDQLIALSKLMHYFRIQLD